MKAKYMMDDQIIHILEIEGYSEVTCNITLFECRIGEHNMTLDDLKKELISQVYYDDDYDNWIEMALVDYGYDECIKCYREEVCDYIDSFIN